MSVGDWFSASYQEAREKFLAACAAGGAGLTSHRCPAAGPDGRALYTDVAWVGPPDAPAVLLTISGTHGAEGYCGSGAQIGTFRSGLAGQLPDGVALLVVHAINPYGFAWTRRVTEDNVDLNRNFLDPALPLPANPAYDEVHGWLVPDDWDGPARAAADAAIDRYLQERGIEALQAAVTGGQYSHADGLFFGGRSPTWSNRTLSAIVAAHLTNRRRVAMLDYHTGLGPPGYGEIICTHDPGTPGHGRAQAWYDGDITSPLDGSSTSAPIQGYISVGLERVLPPAVEFTAVALEYGTVPVMEVLQALRADNWLHARGDPASPLGAEIRAQVRRAFFGDSEQWQRQIWDRAEQVTRRALAGLAA